MDFVRSVYQDVDTLDVHKLIAHLTDDCVFVFGNAAPITGHAAIEGLLCGFFGAIAGIRHEIEECWEANGAIISRMRVTYTRKDRIRKSYPAAVIWRMRGPLIKEFLIYCDNSSLLD